MKSFSHKMREITVRTEYPKMEIIEKLSSIKSLRNLVHVVHVILYCKIISSNILYRDGKII